MSSAFRLVTLLIELGDERGVTRYAAIVVTPLCLTTAAKGATCTPIALRAGPSGNGLRTAGALTPSPRLAETHQRK
jgi:hypothetical protein